MIVKSYDIALVNASEQIVHLKLLCTPVGKGELNQKGMNEIHAFLFAFFALQWPKWPQPGQLLQASCGTGVVALNLAEACLTMSLC